MSKIVQLEELRDYITADGKLSWDGHKTTWVRQDSLLIYLDAIEREVAERFMELPVDADGVPIHVGDEVVSFGCEYKVLGIGVNSYGDMCAFGNKQNTKLRVEECHHAKPRTLEDVLQCAGVSVAAIEDVAAEIRELMVVGE